MTAGSEDQKFVFSANAEFDQLRIDAADNEKEVEVQGTIIGFDGPLPHHLGAAIPRRLSHWRTGSTCHR